MTHKQAVGPHAITVAQEGSIQIPGSGEKGFRMARILVQGHKHAETSGISAVLWVLSIVKVGVASPSYIIKGQ